MRSPRSTALARPPAVRTGPSAGGVVSLQDLVDQLGRRLDVPVTLEDARLRLLVHNAHDTDVDDARARTILSRGSPEGVATWARARGLYEAVAPIRVPAEPGVMDLPRLIAPVRWQERVLGWLCLIDRGDLDEAALELVVETADHAAVILSRGHRAEQQRRADRSTALRQVLHADPAVRAAGLAAVEGEGLLPEGPSRAVVADVAPLVHRDRLVVEDGLQSIADLLPGGQAHVHLRGERAILLLAATDPATATVARVAERLRAAGLQSLRNRVAVGIGAVATSLADAHVSAAQAGQAAVVAGRVPQMGPITAWEGMGAFRALLALPQPVDPTLLHPGVARLAAEDPDGDLLPTAEVYLDAGGRVGLAAADLHVHRGTLYYRLRRFAERTGCDLDDGPDRLAAHLALKALHLQAPA